MPDAKLTQFLSGDALDARLRCTLESSDWTVGGSSQQNIALTSPNPYARSSSSCILTVSCVDDIPAVQEHLHCTTRKCMAKWLKLGASAANTCPAAGLPS